LGLGLLFVPLALVALHGVAEQHAGVAASLLNTGQQVGGAIGLAALGTIAWTTVADNLRNAGRHPGTSQAQLTVHALATGFARGFLAAAGIALLGLVIALATIRVRRQDLTGTRPAPQPAQPPQAQQAQQAEPTEAASQPAAELQQDRVALAAAAVPCRHC
jgi:hypothetical protein